jgi:hypothetical protein
MRRASTGELRLGPVCCPAADGTAFVVGDGDDLLFLEVEGIRLRGSDGGEKLIRWRELLGLRISAPVLTGVLGWAANLVAMLGPVDAARPPYVAVVAQTLRERIEFDLGSPSGRRSSVSEARALDALLELLASEGHLELLGRPGWLRGLLLDAGLPMAVPPPRHIVKFARARFP